MDLHFISLLLREMQVILNGYQSRTFSAAPADNLSFCISHRNPITPFHNYCNLIHSTMFVGYDNTNILNFHADALNEEYEVKIEISPPTFLLTLRTLQTTLYFSPNTFPTTGKKPSHMKSPQKTSPHNIMQSFLL